MTSLADLRIDNATILTLDKDRRIITDGSVAVLEGQIVDVGKALTASKSWPAKKVINGIHTLVMPGFVNGHCHITDFSKGLFPDNLITMDWLKHWSFPILASLTEEDQYWGSTKIMAELLKTGTTCFVDPGVKFIDAAIKAISQTGMRCVTGVWTSDQGGPDADKCDPSFLKMGVKQAIKRIEEAIKKYHGANNGKVKIFATLEGAGTCSDSLKLEAKALADSYGVSLLMHKATSKEEVQAEQKHFGHRSVEHMYKIGALGPNVYLNHMTDVDDQEIAMLAERDTKVCHNPSAALKLAKGTTVTGKFPEMINAGITVALGSDGSNSSDFRDMVREIHLAATLPKDSRLNPGIMTAEKAIEMATIDGAKAISWDNEIGSIEVGKRADIILFDMKRPEWVPRHNVVNNLVYSACGDSVDTVIVDGKVLMENRKLLTIDEFGVLDKVQELSTRVIERAGLKVESRWKEV